MSERTRQVITTSAGSWLGASLGSEIGSLIVMPVGLVLSILLRSEWMIYSSLAGWAFFAGTGGFWIRRHRYRFDLARQSVERHTLWFFRSTKVQKIDFEQIQSFRVDQNKHGRRLIMSLGPHGNWVLQAGSIRRLEPLRQKLNRVLAKPEVRASLPETIGVASDAPATDPLLASAAEIAATAMAAAPTSVEGGSEIKVDAMDEVHSTQNGVGNGEKAVDAVSVEQVVVVETVTPLLGAPVGSVVIGSSGVSPVPDDTAHGRDATASPSLAALAHSATPIPFHTSMFPHSLMLSHELLSDLPYPNMHKLKVGIIGGSGLGQLLGGHAAQGRRHEINTPFGKPSDAIIETEWAGVPVFLLARHGPGHLLNPTQVPYRANIFALKQLGCTHIIATGAVGSLREEMKPRDLAIPEQIIDKTTKRAGSFYDNSAVHVEFSEPFCSVLRQTLMDAGTPPTDGPAADFSTHDRGCYVAMEGPAFSTRAESLMHRLWGGDLIGMTAMPEAKLAREAEISYALVALVTDYDCWRQKPPAAPGQAEQKAAPVDPFVLLKEIIGNLEAASANAMALIRRAIELIAGRQEQLMAAPSRNALQLAIWSERAKIPADEIARLKVLWGRYFEATMNDERGTQNEDANGHASLSETPEPAVGSEI